MSIESQWMEIDGLKLHYQRSGSGPSLLLVHGLLGGSFCWRSNLAEFSQRYTVFAVDLPGSGLSDAPPDIDCGMQAQVNRLSRFIGELQLHKISLLGCSYGGAVALRLAAQENHASPGRIRALVLVAPANPWSEFGQKRIRLLSTAWGGMMLRVAFPFSGPVHRVALRRMYGDARHVTPDARRGYVENIVRPARAQNALSVLRNWRTDMETLRSLIPTVQVPALLITGGRDRAVDPRSCQILKEQLPHCEQVVLPELGHLPFEEAPQQFNQMVLEFLEQSKLPRDQPKREDRSDSAFCDGQV
jgi:4,5:9,10-diseco-3-hydroxy-5,9,17-trioxoandrosta-1(10),2-diene-4-oate hydrolase